MVQPECGARTRIDQPLSPRLQAIGCASLDWAGELERQKIQAEKGEQTKGDLSTDLGRCEVLRVRGPGLYRAQQTTPWSLRKQLSPSLPISECSCASLRR